MKLYHGSSVPGIRALRPALSNHGRPYVYLTDIEPLAAIYAHNPLPSPYGFFPYLWYQGKLHYEEYFHGALREIYEGQTGYVYTCEGDFPSLPKMPWVHLSGQEVPVTSCRVIPDLYEELLALEEAGDLVIHRWEDMSQEKLAQIRRVILREIEQDGGVPDGPPNPYILFIRRHFPNLV